jgi:hypothetical protein
MEVRGQLPARQLYSRGKSCRYPPNSNLGAVSIFGNQLMITCVSKLNFRSISHLNVQRYTHEIIIHKEQCILCDTVTCMAYCLKTNYPYYSWQYWPSAFVSNQAAQYNYRNWLESGCAVQLPQLTGIRLRSTTTSTEAKQVKLSLYTSVKGTDVPSNNTSHTSWRPTFNLPTQLPTYAALPSAMERALHNLRSLTSTCSNSVRTSNRATFLHNILTWLCCNFTCLHRPAAQRRVLTF